MTAATATPATSRDEVPWRIQGAVYGIGLFSTSIFHIAAVIVPLYAATMTPSPLMFGLVFSAAHLLPLFLSIRALVFLQMFLGLSESMGWLGAQTMIGQLMHGKTVYAGRMSFIIRIG